MTKREREARFEELLKHHSVRSMADLVILGVFLVLLLAMQLKLKDAEIAKLKAKIQGVHR